MISFLTPYFTRIASFGAAIFALILAVLSVYGMGRKSGKIEEKTESLTKEMNHVHEAEAIRNAVRRESANDRLRKNWNRNKNQR